MKPWIDSLDPFQREAALSPLTCIVTAGAGAGKTSVLVARFLHLVLDRGIPVRSILALTFTKKAAAEMYERIHAALSAVDSDIARAQVADFGSARISTLDAFCKELASGLAPRLGYTSGFSVDDPACSDLALAVASRFIGQHRGEEGLADLLASFSYASIVRDLFAELGSAFVSPLRLLGPIFVPMGPRLAALGQKALDARLDRLNETCGSIILSGQDIASPHKDCQAALDAAFAFSEASHSVEAPRFPDLSSLSPALLGLSQLGLSSYGRNPEELEVKALAASAREEAKFLAKIADYAAFFPVQLRLLELLDEYAAELAEAKRRADIMDYKDLGACALSALGDKNTRSYWKGRFQAILIDEFQDNNLPQKELLFYLAEQPEAFSPSEVAPEDLVPGKLFFVGDEKQSIYRFRGADVTVFRHLARQVSAAQGGRGALSLAINYRSSSNLVGFFNELFSSVFNEHPAEGRAAWDADYRAMLPPPSREAVEAEFASTIRLIVQEKAEDDPEEANDFLGPDESIAWRTAQVIRAWVGKMELRPKRGQGSPRRAGYGDFAVLLRTTTHQHRLERWFRILNIPYDSEAPRALFADSPANDIYAALCLLADPGDRPSCLAVLRSPLCGISDSGFASLAGWPRLGSILMGEGGELPEDLDEGDRRALAETGAFFRRLAREARTASNADLVECIWFEGGLRLGILQRPSARPFLEHFQALFRLAAEADKAGCGLAGFLGRLRPFIEGVQEVLELESSVQQDSSCVKILTIHKAKGLQFPIVLVPWTEGQAKNRRDQPLWHRLDGCAAIDVKPFNVPKARAENVFFSLAVEEEKQKNLAELRRLFYVACTRAEDHLVFLAKAPKRERLGETSFLYYLESLHEKLKGRIERISMPAVSKAEAFGARTPSPELDPRDFLPAYLEADAPEDRPPRLNVSVSELQRLAASESPQPAPGPAPGLAQDAAEIPLRSPIPPDLFGTLCHEAIEHAVRSGSIEGFVPSEGLLGGIDPEDGRAAIGLSLGFARSFLDGEIGTMLSSCELVETEKPFLISLGGRVIEGRMDLYARSRDVVYVIDFKSDLVEDPQRYSVQLELYRLAACRLEKLRSRAPGYEGNATPAGPAGSDGDYKTVKAGLYWLRSGRLSWAASPLPESELAALAERASRLPALGHGGPDELSPFQGREEA
ncbi:MAG TPA: UvrD-helicase domain-containing protein [Rectinemataceae bacterium]